jgi:hypothetical protein
MSVAGSMAERQLQDAIVEAARLQGWLVYHMHDSRRAGWGTDSAGFPDLVMVRKPREMGGRLIFAELKTKTGTLSVAQKAWLAALYALNDGADPQAGPEVETYLWRPDDWLEGRVEALLK